MSALVTHIKEFFKDDAATVNNLSDLQGICEEVRQLKARSSVVLKEMHFATLAAQRRAHSFVHRNVEQFYNYVQEQTVRVVLF